MLNLGGGFAVANCISLSHIQNFPNKNNRKNRTNKTKMNGKDFLQKDGTDLFFPIPPVKYKLKTLGVIYKPT